MVMRMRFAQIALAVLMLATPIARAQERSFCADCRLQLGVGGTYHFWGSTGGLVVPLTLVWDDERYELGVFRMANTQRFFDSKQHEERQTANPYWGVSASRRWFLIRRPFWRVFFGFGASYKSEQDELSATRWNFASQLGVRFDLNGSGSTVELAMRHWSNAGIRLPNRGQDFATVSFVFSPARVGDRFADTQATAQSQQGTR
jgi:hypothetical protein